MIRCALNSQRRTFSSTGSTLSRARKRRTSARVNFDPALVPTGPGGKVEAGGGAGVRPRMLPRIAGAVERAGGGAYLEGGAGWLLATHRTTSTWSKAHWSRPAPLCRGCHHRSITPLTRASLQEQDHRPAVQRRLTTAACVRACVRGAHIACFGHSFSL